MRLLKVRPTGIFLIAVSATGGLDCTAVVALRTLCIIVTLNWTRNTLTRTVRGRFQRSRDQYLQQLKRSS